MPDCVASGVRLSGRELPVLWRGDVVVAGASFGGIAAALTLARAGRRVAIVEQRTYPGIELTATQRPWLAASKAAEHSLIAACLSLPGNIHTDSETALHLDQLKIHLEDALAAAGVELLYATYPVGLLQADGALSGLVVANKSGRQALLANTLLDATRTALLARLTGAPMPADESPTVYRRTLEFGQLASRHAGRAGRARRARYSGQSCHAAPRRAQRRALVCGLRRGLAASRHHAVRSRRAQGAPGGSGPGADRASAASCARLCASRDHRLVFV